VGAGFGISPVVLGGFLEDLARRGRGSYTIRAYRLGLNDFDRWLVERELTLASVTRRDVEDYIDGFARGYCSSGRPPHAQRDELIELRSGQRRQPGRAARTVNHRLSVLGSFFDYLSDHDVNGRRGMEVSARSRGRQSLGRRGDRRVVVMLRCATRGTAPA
jgi:site-specific recombinase XerD